MLKNLLFHNELDVFLEKKCVIYTLSGPCKFDISPYTFNPQLFLTANIKSLSVKKYCNFAQFQQVMKIMEIDWKVSCLTTFQKIYFLLFKVIWGVIVSWLCKFVKENIIYTFVWTFLVEEKWYRIS